MLSIAIDDYDKEARGVVVGASVDGTAYRKPILNFWREGDARQFCNFLKCHAVSRHVETQLMALAGSYQSNRHRLVTEVEFKLKNYEIQHMIIRRRIENDDETP